MYKIMRKTPNGSLEVYSHSNPQIVQKILNDEIPQNWDIFIMKDKIRLMGGRNALTGILQNS